MNDKPTGVWLKVVRSEQIPNDLMLVTDGTNINIVWNQLAIPVKNFNKSDTTYYMLLPWLTDEQRSLPEDDEPQEPCGQCKKLHTKMDEDAVCMVEALKEMSGVSPELMGPAE